MIAHNRAAPVTNTTKPNATATVHAFEVPRTNTASAAVASKARLTKQPRFL
jgi:hypothetical protein